jgi:hypothetical protein
MGDSRPTSVASRQKDDYTQDLASIRSPVLLIRGRYDRIVPSEVSIAILNHIADSRLVLLNNCGHWPPYALLAQVIDFELVRGTGAVELEPGQVRDGADKCEPLRLSTLAPGMALPAPKASFDIAP